ncbi:MAG: hypothetical protein M3Y70_00395 [Pseudomonadota bacterium]|nr:hypothetical protein [Pseudomonadota bacterium]
MATRDILKTLQSEHDELRALLSKWRARPTGQRRGAEMARKLFNAKDRAELDVAYEEWKASPAADAAVVVAEAETGVKAVARKITRRE